jgi:pimeloyl-ACP methyl ester carboxylesterase
MGGLAAVRDAMQRLLELGGSRARSVHTPLSAPLHHLEDGTGRPVVLLHGGAGGGANWFRLLAPLAADFRVLAPDLPGFGLSAPVAPAAPLGAAAADVLHDWLRAQRVEGALLVGTSFGGLAALRLAQRAPQLVERLLLLDTAGLGARIHPLVRIAAVPGLTRLGVRPSRRGTALMLRRLLTTDRSDLDRDAEAALVAYLHASASVAGTSYLAATLRMFVGPGGQREVLDPQELRALPQAVSVVWGERDRFLPVADARAAARHFRDARLVIVPRAGHSPNWESPAAVLAAVRELAARPLA